MTDITKIEMERFSNVYKAMKEENIITPALMISQMILLDIVTKSSRNIPLYKFIEAFKYTSKEMGNEKLNDIESCKKVCILQQTHDLFKDVIRENMSDDDFLKLMDEVRALIGTVLVKE